MEAMEEQVANGVDVSEIIPPIEADAVVEEIVEESKVEEKKAAPVKKKAKKNAKNRSAPASALAERLAKMRAEKVKTAPKAEVKSAAKKAVKKAKASTTAKSKKVKKVAAKSAKAEKKAKVKTPAEKKEAHERTLQYFDTLKKKELSKREEMAMAAFAHVGQILTLVELQKIAFSNIKEGNKQWITKNSIRVLVIQGKLKKIARGVYERVK